MVLIELKTPKGDSKVCSLVLQLQQGMEWFLKKVYAVQEGMNQMSSGKNCSSCT